MSSAAQQVAQDFKTLWKQEADAFLSGHRADAVALGESTVLDILRAEMVPYFPVPPLSPNAQPMEIAAREAILTENTRLFQVRAKAEQLDGERVKKLRAASAGLVAKLAGSLAGTLFTVGRAVILGA